MCDFILIDLNSQAEAVMHYVKGWGQERILDWLSRFGTVDKGAGFDEGRWYFCSNLGFPAIFRFTEDDELQVKVIRWWS